MTEQALSYRALTSFVLRQALPLVCIWRYCRRSEDGRCSVCRRVIPKSEQPISGDLRRHER